jgi:hypothetical protein
MRWYRRDHRHTRDITQHFFHPMTGWTEQVWHLGGHDYDDNWKEADREEAEEQVAKAIAADMGFPAPVRSVEEMVASVQDALER